MAFEGKFSDSARRALVGAQEAARVMKHNYVGPEHLLLGLLKEPSAPMTELLGGISYDRAMNQALRLVGQGSEAAERLAVNNARANKILEASLQEAANLGQKSVGTEHIWLALLREGESVAARVLQDLGVDLRKTREQLLSQMREGKTPDTKGATETPTLDQYGRDMTQAAVDGELDPVIGRQKEIERITQILIRRRKNNPVLIGEPGVGKSAIVEGLAQRIAEGNIPMMLQGKRVVSLDVASMLAGSKYRGEFEERFKTAMAELKKNGNIILFIDEMHTIVGAGGAEGAIDASNMIKPALARGEIQCIGATTLDEYRKHIEKDPALERRFQPVMVEAPNKHETLEIIKGLRDKYEEHHRVTITDEALKAAVELSDRYISDRFQPDKSIDLMDEAASRVRIQSFTPPPDVKELEAELVRLSKEKDQVVKNQDFEMAANIRDKERELQQEIARCREAWQNQVDQPGQTVGEEEIAQIVASWTGVPVQRMTEDESQRMLHLEDVLHERLIGQDEAVKAVARAIRRARAGLKDPNRPIGSFLFLGPTGVGKTELCRALGEALFGDEDAVIRVDMSEYMEKHAVSRMIGSPPGYIGHDEGGQLTEKVRRKPYAVILLDEIEKAHPDVFNILLQMLEDGHLTDSKGRVVDFKNTIVVMTSNIGASTISTSKRMGFGSEAARLQNYEEMKTGIMQEVHNYLRPEFINRLDETIVFHPLGEEDVQKIAALMLKSVSDRLAERGIHLSVTEDAVQHLAKAGFDPKFGARPLRRMIQRMVEDALSEEILAGSISLDDEVQAYMEDESLKFQRV